MSNKVVFHQNLKLLMAERKISVKELSLQTAVPLKTIYHWLSGQMPGKIDHIQNIANYFNVPFEKLFFENKSLDSEFEAVLPGVQSPEPIEVILKGNARSFKVQIKIEEV